MGAGTSCLRASLFALGAGCSLALCAAAVFVGVGCGGTTGREGLPTSGSDGSDGGIDATVSASLDANANSQGDANPDFFDVALLYADRVLPDVTAPPDANVEAAAITRCTQAGQTNCTLVPCTADLYTYVDAGPDADGGPDFDAAPPYCVSCSGNTTGMCSATEAIFVAIDIAQGAVTDAGPDPILPPTASCYGCLVMAGILDSTTQASPQTVGNECDDLGTVPFMAGNGSMGLSDALCLDTLQCITGTSGDGCALSAFSPTYCMCGAAEEPRLTCQQASGGMNGPCLTPELNGLQYPASDNNDLITSFVTTTFPSGVANQLVYSAAVDGCFPASSTDPFNGHHGTLVNGFTCLPLPPDAGSGAGDQ
jgi:hypothetical protein